MQQFTVPQFIDVEDKIIGPITVRQFVIMLAGFMLIALCYRIFQFSLFIGSGLFIFALSGTFAFLKINGMPFHFFVLNFIQTSSKPKMRIWISRGTRLDLLNVEEESVSQEFAPAPKKRLSSSRLSELSLIVDTSGAYRGEEEKTEDPVSAPKEAKEQVKTFSFKV